MSTGSPIKVWSHKYEKSTSTLIINNNWIYWPLDWIWMIQILKKLLFSVTNLGFRSNILTVETHITDQAREPKILERTHKRMTRTNQIGLNWSTRTDRHEPILSDQLNPNQSTRTDQIGSTWPSQFGSTSSIPEFLTRLSDEVSWWHSDVIKARCKNITNRVSNHTCGNIWHALSSTWKSMRAHDMCVCFYKPSPHVMKPCGFVMCAGRPKNFLHSFVWSWILDLLV